jgi:chromosomal replication initiation ATPase DnaA
MMETYSAESCQARAGLAKDIAAYALSVERALLDDPKRGPSSAAFARQVAMYLMHTAFGFSLNRVAVAFQRDRSTVAHACRLIEDQRDDFAFVEWIETLENVLRQAPEPRAHLPQALA